MRKIAVFAAAAVLALAVLPCVGDPFVWWSGLWRPETREILLYFRLPRVLFAFVVGAALSVAGAAFQALFRNPLATPYTLGISSGAGFGAALAIHAGIASPVSWLPATSVLAFAGAVSTVALVYGFTRIRGGLHITTLLLAGVAINFFFSALVLLLQYLSDFTQTHRMLSWLMGNLDIYGYREILVALIPAAAGIAFVWLIALELDMLVCGEELAGARGVATGAVKLAIFRFTSLLVGAVVAVSGPIGFVGLIVPHMARLLVGPRHSLLIPASILLGAAFLACADTVARVIIYPAQIPVGVITALLGGPFFLWLLLRREYHF